MPEHCSFVPVRDVSVSFQGDGNLPPVFKRSKSGLQQQGSISNRRKKQSKEKKEVLDRKASLFAPPTLVREGRGIPTTPTQLRLAGFQATGRHAALQCMGKAGLMPCSALFSDLRVGALTWPSGEHLPKHRA